MELADDDDERLTPRNALGRRFKRLRKEANLSQRELAKAVRFRHTYISRVEQGKQLPSQGLLEALVRVLGERLTVTDLLADLVELAQEAVIPDYFRSMFDGEASAARIQAYESSVVPGLLQTEDYALALFRAALPWESDEQLRERVEARTRRQQVFDREEPLLYWAIMDEAVLRRPTGGRQCMAQQLAHIIAMPERPGTTIQVVPFDQGEHPMLGGGLTLQTSQSGETMAYIESFAVGHLTESPRKVLQLTQRFDVTRAKALSAADSVEILENYRKGYSE